MEYVAHQVYPGIFQGPVPPRGHYLSEAGIKVLVLCAAEFQPEDAQFPGVRVIRASSNDVRIEPPKHWTEAWHSAAESSAHAVRQGETVLITCWQGLNRSGVVSALTINKLTGKAGAECVNLVKQNRPGAFSNENYAEYVSRIQTTHKEK